MSLINQPAELPMATLKGRAVNNFAGDDAESLNVESPVTTREAEHRLEQGQEPDLQSKARLWNRRFSMLPQAHAEPRPYQNKYFCKRPKILQYYHQGALVDSTGRRITATRGEELMMPSGVATEEGEEKDYVETEGATSMKQRDWLNLFIDLLWVGILSNVGDEFVAHAFAGEDWGNAFLEFLVLYLTAFRFWSFLRKFLNNYFSKDIVQSLFISWCLVLALLFGNQTTYFLTGGDNIVIWTYLVVRGSFFWIEIIYCIFIPQIRQELKVTSLLAIPIAVIWGIAAAINWPTRAIPILIALVLEGLITTFLVSPLGEWFLRGAPRKAVDAENLVDRLQGFFVIVLGEGVYTLIVAGKWGSGLSAEFALAVEALFIYYNLFWFFFYGDHTKTYIHAIYRNRYTSLLFQLFHCVLYGAVLLIVASIGYLVEETQTTTSADTESEGLPTGILLARWTLSGSIALALLTMTGISLLNRSLDRPKTLIINNRYLRMIPRVALCTVILCLPAKQSLSNVEYLGIVMGLLQPLLFIEFIAGMERPFNLWEPKGNHEQ